MAKSRHKRSITIARHRTSISLEDAFWQALIDEVVDLIQEIVARDEYLFEERQVLVIFVDLAFDQRADLISRPLGRGDLGQMVRDRSDLFGSLLF